MNVGRLSTESEHTSALKADIMHAVRNENSFRPRPIGFLDFLRLLLFRVLVFFFFFLLPELPLDRDDDDRDDDELETDLVRDFFFFCRRDDFELSESLATELASVPSSAAGAAS